MSLGRVHQGREEVGASVLTDIGRARIENTEIGVVTILLVLMIRIELPVRDQIARINWNNKLMQALEVRTVISRKRWPTLCRHHNLWWAQTFNSQLITKSFHHLTKSKKLALKCKHSKRIYLVLSISLTKSRKSLPSKSTRIMKRNLKMSNPDLLLLRTF